MNENVLIISSEKNWLEQSAVEQLNNLALLPGMIKAVGLPDLHPGKTPVGAAFITEGIIYPHIIGNDIGCGMSLFAMDIERKKLKIEKLIKRLEEIEDFREIGFSDTIDSFNNMPFNTSLGTIGGGNHFTELQEIDTVFDEELFDNLNMNKNGTFLLVHSGSRGYGQLILDEFIKNHEAQKGLKIDSEAAQEYLFKHNDAVNWASINRKLIATRFISLLNSGSTPQKIMECVHNSITLKNIDNKPYFIHRKGAAPSDTGPIVIPGSRGSLTYLVMPENATSLSAYSLAHGAGRKWQRGICKSKLENKYTKETIKSTKYKSRIICKDKNLLYEEAPEAYKKIETVIQDLVDANLIKVVATLKPILTYKS